MSLANPSSLAITRLRRVYTQPPSMTLVNGTPTSGFVSTFQLFGRVSWVNTETDPHQVKVVVERWKTPSTMTNPPSTFWLPLGATSLPDIRVADDYVAPFAGTKKVVVKVQLVDGTADSDVVELTATLDGMATGALSGPMTYAAGAITIPAWTGALARPELILPQVAAGRYPIGGNTQITPTGLINGSTFEARFVALDTVTARTSPAIAVLGIPITHDYLFSSSYGTDPLLTLFATPAEEDEQTFTATSRVVQLVRGSLARIELFASHPATWVIDTGAPSQFAIVAENGRNYLVGTPTATGGWTVTLTATRTADDATATATLSLTVTATEAGAAGSVEVITNPGWLNNGFTYKVGDQVVVALASRPGGAFWSATSLPTGLSINADTGVISGVLVQEGRWIAMISAAVEGLPPSPEVPITFTVRAGELASPVNPPRSRVPWVADKWDWLDLQILARTREIQSTLAAGPGAALRLKVGDTFNFAVLFVGADDRVFDLEPDRLRITIRPADNLDSPLVFESDASPEAADDQPDPYYLITAITGSRQREVVQAWVEDAGKNDPIPCVLDVDWMVGEQHFSSATLPVLLELDVTRP